jgi:hypothetical protein
MAHMHMHMDMHVHLHAAMRGYCGLYSLNVWCRWLDRCMVSMHASVAACRRPLQVFTCEETNRELCFYKLKGEK